MKKVDVKTLAKELEKVITPEQAALIIETLTGDKAEKYIIKKKVDEARSRVMTLEDGIKQVIRLYEDDEITEKAMKRKVSELTVELKEAAEELRRLEELKKQLDWKSSYNEFIDALILVAEPLFDEKYLQKA